MKSFEKKLFLPAYLAMIALDSSAPSVTACQEKPSVWLDESTAATHLLSKKDPELPAHASELGSSARVSLRVTVDRKGVVCDLRPLAGPRALRGTAVAAVKKHWRYRPFLVDWKPVVAQFPVTVRFAAPKRDPAWRLAWRRGYGAAREMASR